MKQKIRLAISVLAVLSLASLAVGFRVMLTGHLPSIFSAPEEDMDYAWFVPVFSAFVLWRDRKRIRASLGSPSVWGLVAALPFILLGFFGVRGVQVRFELLAFMGLLVAIPWAFYGRRCAKSVAFPVACLVFCMPMASYLSLLTVHLRLFASAVSGGILSIMFPDVVRHGNMIAFTGLVTDGNPFVIDIADPCSGLRSVIALAAISVGYGYWTQPTWTRRLALLVASLPIAVAGNIVRILSIGMVAKFASSDFAMGYYHDFSGFIVFAVAIALLVAAGSVVDRVCGAVPEAAPGAEPEPEKAPSADGPAALVVPVLSFVVVAASMFCLSRSPAPVLTEAPTAVFPGIPGFRMASLDPSVAETNILRGAKVEKIRYDAEGGFWIQATAVTSGANKNSLHRPELCLPSNGIDMLGSRSVVAGGVPWRMIRLGSRSGGSDSLFAYSFVNQDGYRTDSHEARIWRDIWDRTVKGRIDRWIMLTVLFPAPDEEAFIRTLGLFRDISHD